MPVDFNNELVALTCASGKQCSRLIPLLYNRWKNIRLVVHSSSSETRLKEQYPNAQILRADLTQPEDVERVLSGVSTIVHIGPPLHPHETEIGYAMIDAACRHQTQNGGVFKHFIYSSVLHPQLRKLMNHDCKRYVEEYLIESGLHYTIVQTSHMLDMFPVVQLLQQKEPIFYANFNPGITFSFTILQDLAEAFLKVIEEREKHYLAEYMLCSTGPVSYEDVTAVLSKVAGRPIQIRTRDYFDAVTFVQTMLAGDPNNAHRVTRDAVQRLLLYYNFYGIKGNTNVLQWIIGREPTTVNDFFRERVSELQNEC
ncbi:hypothetical protein THITE_2120667 [Paecilomyces variotii No. 5]|uniref:NmrA-like domain-containing protein n=1 Tax=Byssochlamys spectabilis (strain No. 5 / NBRC 109023) TaxID=1356009 RepID=V5FP10_BYSSN|nr:hypothetical protein THITE_2120667 [Paecilomyces variotii No. 5]